MNHFKNHTATQSTVSDYKVEYGVNQIHTALPAKVLKFDPEKQTVELQIQIKQVLESGDSDISPLLDVPVSYPKGGGFCITFPLEKGDEGLAVFSERCIDGWWQNGISSRPLDFRTHDFSDAIFIPGVSSLPNVVKPFFKDGISMQTLDESVYFRLTPNGIFIKGDIQQDGNLTSRHIQEDRINAGSV